MRIHIVLPDDLVKGIDELVGKRKRSRFIAEAVSDRLRRERLRKAIREGAGAIDVSRHPEWETREKVVEWVRALRRTPTAYEKRRGQIPAGLKRSD